MILCYKKKKLLTRLKIIFIVIFFIIDIKNISSQESILSKGDWIRIGITKNGVYKLDRSFFESYSSKIDIEKATYIHDKWKKMNINVCTK